MSFPNPAMLPFFAAGGAISGASFGLMYTVLMQIGYNYYGKLAIKRVEAGEQLSDVLMDIQKEIRPFSDQMMQMALDSMPEVLTKTVSSIHDLIRDVSTPAAENAIKNLFGIDVKFGVGGAAAVVTTPSGKPTDITVDGDIFKPSPGAPKPDPAVLGTTVRKSEIFEPAGVTLSAARLKQERTLAARKEKSDASKAALVRAAVVPYTRADAVYFDNYRKANIARNAIRGKSSAGQSVAVRKLGFSSVQTMKVALEKNRQRILAINDGWAKYSIWLKGKADRS